MHCALFLRLTIFHKNFFYNLSLLSKKYIENIKYVFIWNNSFYKNMKYFETKK